jgi:hypothetical protein
MPVASISTSRLRERRLLDEELLPLSGAHQLALQHVVQRALGLKVGAVVCLELHPRARPPSGTYSPLSRRNTARPRDLLDALVGHESAVPVVRLSRSSGCVPSSIHAITFVS